MSAGSNCIIFDDLEWPLTRVSRSLYTYKSNISKRCVLRTKLLKNSNRKHTIYRMVPFSMTLSDIWPQFQGHDIFQHWMSQKRHEIEPFTIECQWSRMRSIAWWHFQWHWRTPNPVFKVTVSLKSNILKTVHLRDKVSTEQQETTPSLSNGTTFNVLE